MTAGAAPPDPAVLAAAVGRCPSVTALYGGRFGEVTSYLPGERIVGVSVSPDGVRVAVISNATATAAGLRAEISAALAPHVGRLPVAIEWADIAAEGA